MPLCFCSITLLSMWLRLGRLQCTFSDLCGGEACMLWASVSRINGAETTQSLLNNAMFQRQYRTS